MIENTRNTNEILNNKKILMFAPKFFGYDNAIKTALEKEGANVHLYDERPNPNSVEKILIRKLRGLVKRKIHNYYKRIITQEKEFNPDYILFINPEAIDNVLLKKIKNQWLNARLILYMWDSTKNKKIKKTFNQFDSLYSFDPDDCRKYKLNFRPLFFIPELEKTTELERQDYKYDLSFIGTVHSDRAKIILEISKYCNANNISYFWYLYIPGRLMYLMRMLVDSSLRKIDQKYIHLVPMKKSQFAEISEKTRCVIDINHPKQTGLTMRTIEMVGGKRKILTTNKQIKTYDFYVPSNQIVISREEIKFNKEDLKKNYIDISSELYEKYSLKGWIKDIFEIEKKGGN